MLQPAVNVAVALGLVDELRVRRLARLLADLDKDLLLVHPDDQRLRPTPECRERRKGGVLFSRFRRRVVYTYKGRRHLVNLVMLTSF